LPPLPHGVVVVALLVYMALAVLVTTSEIALAEYAHEDTIFADGFSLTRWRQLRIGMTKPEIHEIMGSPLPSDVCLFGDAAECWVSNNSAGHFAVVWFAANRATRVYRWYSD
jgi:outer membrane protein assembly factor BamE (lipoprotein component of BamABCDE complex)